MNNLIENPEVIVKMKDGTKKFVTGKIFDVIGISIVVVVFFVGLGALKLIDFTLESFGNFLISFVPFYLAAMVLNTNYYTKGVFKAKSSETYKQAMIAYNDIVNGLSGEEQLKLQDFVDWYNQQALEKLQASILKRTQFTFQRFNEITYDKDGNELLPLKVVPKAKLLSLCGGNKDIVRLIERAKNAHVHGLTVNILMSSIQAQDATNLGKSEEQVRKIRLGVSAVVSFLAVFVMSMIAFKDIIEWGWVAAFVSLFKMVYIFARSYMMYFDAYGDITGHVVNHLARKTDIIKQFKSWYKQLPPEENTECQI